MPVSKNKLITLSPEGSTPESASNALPKQEEFRQHLCRLAGSFACSTGYTDVSEEESQN